MNKYTNQRSGEQYLPTALFTEQQMKKIEAEVRRLRVDSAAFTDVRRLFMIILRVNPYEIGEKISDTGLADIVECFHVISGGSPIPKFFLHIYFFRFDKRSYKGSFHQKTINENWCNYGRFNRDRAIDHVIKILTGTSNGLNAASLFYLLRHPSPDFDWFFLATDDGCEFKLDQKLNAPSTFVECGSRFLLEQGRIFYPSRT